MGRIRHVVLVGLPGAGKSSVGRAVAERLRRPFLDLDVAVERSFGLTVSEIFRIHGEVAFRTREADVTQGLREMAPSVVAPGGGWVSNGVAVAHLRGQARTIYLRVPPGEALRRMRAGVARRPLLANADDPLEALEALHASRDGAYAAIADVVLDTRGAGRSQVVARVLAAITASENNSEEGA